MAVIQTDRLTKYYGKARGVIDLDLSVEKGEIFGFLGPNGAGKTTTIRVLLGYLNPTSGSATVLGLDANRDSLALRTRIGYLPGELALYPKLTGEQTIRYLANLRDHVDWGFVLELADRLDFDLTRKVGKLSSGNKQKLGLIQALMGKPDLLILDEPTGGLDPLIQQSFYELVLEAKARGQTVFLSSHVLPEVERICDRVGIIREGRLVAVETVTELKKKAMRRLVISFDEPVSQEMFEGLSGVQDVVVSDSQMRCTVIGSLDAVIKAAAQHKVFNVRSEEPRLEEIFLAYYGKTPNGVKEA